MSEEETFKTLQRLPFSVLLERHHRYLFTRNDTTEFWEKEVIAAGWTHKDYAIEYSRHLHGN